MGHAHLPNTQRENFAQLLAKDLLVEQDSEGITPDAAFLRVAVKTLGFDPDIGHLTDGPSDYGFDFITINQEEASVFQAKSLAFEGVLPLNEKLDSSYLHDLRRIVSVLGNLNDIPQDSNKRVHEALIALRNEVNRRALLPSIEAQDRSDTSTIGTSKRLISDEPEYKVSVYFLGLARAFTAQAETEFARLTDANPIMAGRVRISISVIPVFIDDLLAEKWQQRNVDWKDRLGAKREEVTVSVVGDAIVDAKSAVFFTRAHDLVRAFEDYGYQIFEPNVRCELKESKVNQAIKATIKTREGRREFRHLNNGITVVCQGYTAKRGQDKKTQSFTVRKPGVVNGLQTVKSLHDAFRRLPQDDQLDFQEHCLILCRLHQEGSVSRLEQLVKATNNQNPMKARNLRSNDPEQVAYETMFADIGWFYERKQGAWDAFRADPRGWRGLSGKRQESFQVGSTKTYRVLDNDDIAQSWLAFIGFSTEAINDKRTLFEQDNLYGLIFLRRTAKHGADYDFKLTLDSDVHKEATEGSPESKLLLIASLTREAADRLAVGRRDNREASITRLQLAGRGRDLQDRELEEDETYQTNKLIRGMLTLFVEFVGFILFRALGSSLHAYGGSLLKNGSFSQMVTHNDASEMTRRYREEIFEKTDLMPILFAAFEHCVKQLYASNWLRAYNDAPVKNKFIYSLRTRRELLHELEELDKRFSRGEWVRSWADGFNEANGVFSHVRAVLLPTAMKAVSTQTKSSLTAGKGSYIAPLSGPGLFKSAK